MLKIDKNSRHRAIRQIIETQKVSTQLELKELLEKRGVKVTQATLSRDLNALQIVKIPDPEKGSIYTVPERLPTIPTIGPDHTPLQTCRSLAFSGNIGILKCLPSFAPSVAMVIDSLNIEEILGTVAGDDTIIIVLKEGVTKEQFKKKLMARCPELSGII